MKEESQEFRERKALIELQKEADQIKHKLRMELLQFERETNRIFHEHALERGRIKNAEERKLVLYKNNVRGGRR